MARTPVYKINSSKSKHNDDAYTTLILDLGDVIFHWSPITATSVSGKELRRALSSGVWVDFESGLITQEQCYTLISKQLSIDPQQLKEALDLAQESLVVDMDMVELVQSLREAHPGLRIYAMSNISHPHYEVLRRKMPDWSIFDRVFTSAAAGVCKPELSFYHQVIEATGCEPKNTIFVDDKLDNVISARSLGIEGIVFDKFERVSRLLHNLLDDPIERAQAFLNANAGRLLSCTSNGITIHENFAQLFILDLTKNEKLVNYVHYPRQWNFFEGAGELTTVDYPCDFDTTALAWEVLDCDPELLDSIMTEMLRYRNDDGILEVYYDRSRPRIDPIVCAQVLRLFFKHGRAHEVTETLDWVYDVLTNRAYLDGSRYYLTPEVFLWYIDRLISLPTFRDHRPWRAVLTKAVQERVGAEGDAAALGMRLCVCASSRVRADGDLKKLLMLQSTDGGWKEGWVYRYPMSGIGIGNDGLTTAVAMKAIQGMGGMKVASDTW